MNSPGRMRLLSIGVMLFALLLIAKLYEVQVLKGEIYRAKADHQYVEGGNYFDRGSIFFTAKGGSHVPAASVKTGFMLTIDPQLFRKMEADKEDIYKRINAVTPIDKLVWDTKASKDYDPYEELAKRLSSDVAKGIQALGIPGVSVFKEDWRVYPGGPMAAHAVGFVGYGGPDGTELAGRYGLERYYENVLKRSGNKAFVNFFAEVFSDIKKTLTPGESLEGDIVTTIEPSVESILEEELERLQGRYLSEFSGGIIIDPKTGEIYAMALSPSFDPNSPQSADSSEIFSNKLVEDRYEMGSIVKALTMAAGLDSGAVSRKTVYNDPGCQTLDKKTFCNYDGVSHGNNLPMQVVLNKSLNTGAAFVVSKMGNGTFRKYMLDYGLGELTGIDLPNEGKSLIANLSSPRDLEYAQASFGQGVAFTPVQMVRALSVLANGGYLITPHLVKKIEYEIGTSKEIKPERGDQVFKKGTSEEISRMLTEVVDTALKDGHVRLSNYSVAAKTGTAQIANPAGGGYYPDQYLHSFFGYFPSYDPRFLIFLYTYYPKGVQYASETLTDSFINLTKFLISYYNIAPDRQAPPPPIVK
ncbi:penicillin-binding protein 2 [Candidatus Parcubacteria bacterium]|nr:penicillin-binding protein 2 [Candidatus Parcubacteria bacterium]